MELTIEDTLAERRKPVRSLDGGSVRLYVCGPTVYAEAHVGHARTYLTFDVARRFLEAEGRRVRHVMNITDVEDKIDQRAEELGTTSRALARREERGFLRDIAALGVEMPESRPRASEYVPAMVAVGRALERSGRVRRAGDEWYYEPPPRSAGENFLSGQELAAHAVPEPGHPFASPGGGGRSFLVWKRQAPPLPSWPSPWGPGVPGWHLECFVMAERLLGVPVDLHGGGRDLIFPHHFAENEVALELEGRPFSSRYLHTGFVLQGGTKMSKSAGNLVPLREALSEVGAGPLRWYLSGTAYRDRLPWDPKALTQAAEEYRSVRSTIRSWLAPGAGGRGRASSARALSESVRREIASGLRLDRGLARIARFARALEREPSGRIARGERPAGRAAIRSVERRIGIPLR